MEKPYFYRFARPIIKYLFLIIYRPKIIGKNNIPKNCSVIIAGNHTNMLDCLLLISSTNRTIHFLAKDSLYKGMKKILFKNMGIIPVNRKIHDKSVISKANSLLKDNKVIGIFPEGTINRTNNIILPFKYGAVKMASDTNSYIVPFCISGKYKMFKNRIKIEFYKPYKLDGNNLETANKKLMEIVSNGIIENRK